MISLIERNRRYRAIRELMGQDDFDCLVVAGRDGFGCRGNVRYVANYGINFGEQFCLFPADEDPVFLGSVTANAQVCKDAWVDELYEVRDLPRQLVEQISRFHKGKRIGIVGLTSISVPVYLPLKEKFGAKLLDATWIFRQLRLVKSTEEVDSIRTAVEIADKAYEAVRDMIQPGISDFEIYGEVKRIVHALGCEYSMDFIDAQGAKINFFNPRGNVLEENGTLALEITPAFQGYHGQLAMTLPVRDYPLHIKPLLPVWREALRAGVEALKPGARFCDIYRRVTEVITAHGYRGHLRCGHSVGLDPLDFCALSNDDTTEIKENVTLALHPCVALEGGEGIGMGYTYLVTKNGAEKLGRVNL
jgi:Xaa-Pro dipeptidase